MRIGSLFSGVGGLDLAVEAFFDAETAWFVEFDKAPSKVLAHHWPDVPNYGDVRAVDWAAVEPVDILTGGFPCQDLSLAGRRKGMRPGTRSGLWADYLTAIKTIRPKLAVIENVRGLLSACAESDMGQCLGCVDGTGKHQPPVRALGRVLGDLANIGYDTEWYGVRAADAGAPHNRFRVFVLAYPASSGRDRGTCRTVGESLERVIAAGCSGSAPEDAYLATRGQRRLTAPGQAESGRTRANTGRRSGTPAGDADDTGLEGRPLPGERSSERAAGSHDLVDWGQYEPAIRRWEQALGRPAPAPTRADGKSCGHRLNPLFVEWMMGWPVGWVTDSAIGLSRTEQLKALGNGVVPQQALLALDVLMNRTVVAA